MYPKGSKDDSCRSSRTRKRRFQGNQFCGKENIPVGESSSARKLSTASSEDIVFSPMQYYRIVEFMTVFGAISNMVICKDCKQKTSFNESGHRGLGFKIIISCQCGGREINSGPFIRNAFEINTRIVLVMRLLGVARNGINLFCGLMDIGQGLSKQTYDNIVQHIHSAVSIAFDAISKKAIQEEKQKNIQNNRPMTNLKVSGDGSWKKRGFTSLYGVTTLIAYYTGKVIDICTKSSFCQSCKYWENKAGTEKYVEWAEDHEETCSANHTGSAGKMEVDSIVEMFRRFDEKFGMKYGTYIGDGHSKTYKGILDSKPYGEDFEVIKSECIGHVEKRMGSRLRGIKKRERLGGKGKLTDVLINKLTKYYGLAIRRNSDSVENMKNAIMATFDHLISTNEKPMHAKCPAGAQSWCKWQVEKAAGERKEFDHPAPLHPDVQRHILPIFEDLSRYDLLERCLGGHTQNANESFNSTVWRLAPKHLHCGLKVIEIAAYIAAGIFNEGYYAVMKIFNILELKIGPQCRMYAENQDAQRVKRQEQRSKSRTKEGRTARRDEQTRLQSFYEETEGLLYGPGIAD